MRNFKRLAASLVALVLVIAFSSCEKQPTGDALQEVSFNINNVTDILKKAVGPQDQEIPTCVDSLPSYVVATIMDSEGASTEYKLNVLGGLNDGTETQVIKLMAGTYSLDRFEVYAQGGSMIWATPTNGSFYANLWSLKGVSFDFDVTAFTKMSVDVDVLCWEEYFYEEFGFNWFDFQEVKIKTICFFGDICTEEYALWGKSQYDFVANYRIEIMDGEDMVASESTYEWEVIAAPLCIEYPDYGDRTNETYTVNFYIMTPDGEEGPASMTLNADTGVLMIDGDDASTNDINGEEDMDGIFDFVFYQGDNCNYSGNAGVNFVGEFDYTPETDTDTAP